MKKEIVKKGIIIYHLIIIVSSLIFNSIAIYENNGELNFLIVSEVLLLIGLYYIIKTALELNNYKGNLFLFVFNILQSLAIGFMGFIYKITYGPQIFFRISNFGDWTMETSFRLYSREFYTNVTPPDGLFYLGFNIIQILLAIYFFKFLKREYGKIFSAVKSKKLVEK